MEVHGKGPRRSCQHTWLYLIPNKCHLELCASILLILPGIPLFHQSVPLTPAPWTWDSFSSLFSKLLPSSTFDVYSLAWSEPTGPGSWNPSWSGQISVDLWELFNPLFGCRFYSLETLIRYFGGTPSSSRLVDIRIHSFHHQHRLSSIKPKTRASHRLNTVSPLIGNHLFEWTQPTQDIDVSTCLT